MSRGTSIDGKSVVVTGASRGIGAATARALAKRGARVCLLGLEPDNLRRVSESLRGEHLWFEADVTDQIELEAAVAGTVERFGRIDAVVANAGIVNYGTIRTVEPDDFARTVEVNLTGVYRTISACLPHLIASRGYALVVASLASFVALPGAAAYSASKSGVEALALVLRAELAPHGVAVGSAHPCWIDTDMVRAAEAALPAFREMRRRLPWPLKATTSVDKCADALVRAVENRARRVYVPRSVGILSALRPLLSSSGAERVTARHTKELVPLLERQVEDISQGTR